MGGIYRYNITSGGWTNISPQTPGAGTNPQFGYLGLALDPQSSTTIAVTSINRYSGPDQLWRTTTANATAPAWVAMYSTSSAQNYGYGGYDTTRDTSSAPWIAAFGDGIGNWAATVAIDPFNSAHLMYGDGQGLWATNDATSSSTLTAANSWYFPDYGIEFTAVYNVAAPASGIPLYSAMGDIKGFAHTTLTSSPAAGNLTAGGGSFGPIDFDQANPNYVSSVSGSFTLGGGYSTNDGATWTGFAAQAGSGGGSIAVSPTVASGQPTLVWAPSGGLPFYSTNNGTTWTQSTTPSGTLSSGTIISDRVADGTFYYWTENSSDNQFSTYKSTDGGKTFTLVNQYGTGNASLVANPFVAGDLWVAEYSGLLHSNNFGSSYSSLGGISAGYKLGLGAAAPGRTNAAVYMWGTIGGVQGVYRSDDSGVTWVRVNDVSHQWGGLVGSVAADPNVFGRVYLGTNGRGVIVGNPVSALPTGWSDQDVNLPGNPGWATSSTTLSTGTVVSNWIVNGGGAGIGGTTDQFNFASTPVSGNYAISAQLLNLDNPGTGTPQAGVMFRASSNSNDPFVAIMQTTANQLLLEYRTSSGGSVTTNTLGGIPLGTEYLNLVRTGNTFIASYGSDGLHWTQLGSTVTITAMPATATAGLAVTASYNPQLSTATFSNLLLTSTSFTGAAGADTYAIRLNPSNTLQEQIFVNTPESGTPTYSVSINGLSNLTFTPAGGDGSLTVDFSNGNPLPSGGVTYMGGANPTTSGNALRVVGASSGSLGFSIGSTQVAYTKAASSPIAYSNLQTIEFDLSGGNNVLTQQSEPAAALTYNAGSGSNTLVVNGGTFTFSADPQTGSGGLAVSDNSAVIINAPTAGIEAWHLSSLVLGASAMATLLTASPHSIRSVLILGTLSVAATGTLDLGGNDMIIHSANVSDIFSLIQSASNSSSGAWDGPGITSSAARTDTTHLTTLGEMSNNGSSGAINSTFDSFTALSSDILVKYTYYGDALLHGNVDASDYARIDSGFLTQSPGWYNGDFNHDQVVNGSDYTLIDNAFNTQEASLAAVVTSEGLKTNAKALPICLAAPISTEGNDGLSFKRDKPSHTDFVSSVMYSESALRIAKITSSLFAGHSTGGSFVQRRTGHHLRLGVSKQNMFSEVRLAVV